MFTIVKGFAYKFCFCLGLGTVTYYSYGQVQKFVSHDVVISSEQVIEKKMNHAESPSFGDSYVPTFNNNQPVVPSAAVPAVTAEVPAVAPPAVAAEEKKDEEKKDETAENKEESPASFGGVMSYAPQIGHAPASVRAPEEVKQNNSDLAISPKLLASPSPASGYVSSASGTSFTSNGALDNSDIAALIIPMKANFVDEMSSASGLLCQIGGSNCSHVNHAPVHTLRWGMAEGIKKEVTFMIKSLGGSSLEFNFDIKVQNSSSVIESISLSAHPTEVNVHQEIANNKIYRVFDFKFSDLTVSGNIIKNVQATMMYEVTTSGLVLSPESTLSFNRSHVQTLVTAWDPTVPSQSGVFLIADELSFSMNIEKLL